MARMSRKAFAVLLAALIALAACGGPKTPTPFPASTPDPTVSIIFIPSSSARILGSNPLLRYRGLANVRGRLIGVIDLMHFMGGEPSAAGEATQLLVFGEALNVNAALLITRAFGLRNLNELEPLGRGQASAPWESLRYRDMDGTQLTELRLERLVTSERFAMIGA